MAKILVAEDEPDIRDLIVFILRMLGGYEVVAANNGEEAVQLAFKEIPDLILTDVRMPKMSGYEACQRIKAEPTTKHIPVVFLTARGHEHRGGEHQVPQAARPDHLRRGIIPAEVFRRGVQERERQRRTQHEQDPLEDIGCPWARCCHSVRRCALLPAPPTV